MRYRGREIDPVALWENYVDFPTNMRIDEADQYLPKVVCPNPDHDTLKKHFQINARDGLVHCFAGCGISGTFEKAIAMIEGVTPREARKVILKHARSGRISRSASARKASQRNSRATETVSPRDLEYESFIPAAGMEYMGSRGITSDSIAAWNLGWLPDDLRIAIPARDERGVLRFLIKRAVHARQNPKYLYTEGFPKTSLLFGACQIDLGMVRSSGLIIVEGSLDAIRLHQHGLRNSVAILGTGISEEQRRIISQMRPRKIFLMFDKDTAGVHNIEIAAQKLRKYPMFVCRYPRGKSDPAELTREEAYRIIDRSIPLIKFQHSLNVNRKRKEASFG